MVDPGELVTVTLRREFGEETMNTLEVSPEERRAIEQKIKSLFKSGFEVNVKSSTAAHVTFLKIAKLHRIYLSRVRLEVGRTDV